MNNDKNNWIDNYKDIKDNIILYFHELNQDIIKNNR